MNTNMIENLRDEVARVSGGAIDMDKVEITRAFYRVDELKCWPVFACTAVISGEEHHWINREVMAGSIIMPASFYLSKAATALVDVYLLLAALEEDGEGGTYAMSHPPIF